MGGVLFASSMMYVRVFIEISVINPELLHPLWIPLLVMFTGLLLGGTWIWRRKSSQKEEPELDIGNPFKLGMALKFGALLAVILFLSAAMEDMFGNRGLYILSLISGMVNMDAITVSLARLARYSLDAEVARTGIVLAAVMSTAVKGFIFAFFVGMKESVQLIITLIMAALPGLFIVLFFL